MGKEIAVHKPVILREGTYSDADIKKLKGVRKDIYESQLDELFEITNPGAKFQPDFDDQLKKFKSSRLRPNKGDWIFFPWDKVLLHMVPERDFFHLRTNRNRNLITNEEQQKLSDATVAIAGLSVGSTIAQSLVITGIANRLKLAESDKLATTNLNRIKARVYQIGEDKINIACQAIYDLNPYAELDLLPGGLTQKNLNNIFNSPKPVAVFDEIDDFEMKVRLRIAAKQSQVPVFMMTSLGDTVLVDIERYDEDQNLPIFNGLLGTTADEILQIPLTESAKVKYAIQIVGIDNIPTRALSSMLEINHTLVGRPQLGGTVTLDAGIAAYLMRRLILGADLPSGRRKLSLSHGLGLIDPDNGRQDVLEAIAQRMK